MSTDRSVTPWVRARRRPVGGGERSSAGSRHAVLRPARVAIVDSDDTTVAASSLLSGRPGLTVVAALPHTRAFAAAQLG
jgi:hypothetical protein